MAHPPLMDHQVEGVQWLCQRDTALLADEPGLGKTAQLLLAATEPVIVTAPAMVLDSGVWDDDIAKFAPGMDVTQVAYTMLNVRGKNGRIERDFNGFPIVEPKPEYRHRWGTKIADESHYLKGRKTGWTSGFQQLRADRSYLATGTPIPNWAHEAFTTLQVLFPEEAKPGKRFGSYWRWVNEWFRVEASFFNPAAKEIGDLLPNRTWADFKSENWGDRMLLRLRDECLDLPPLTVTPWEVTMGREQARVYRGLRKDFVAWLDSGQEVVAWNSAALTVKLAKCATGLEVLERGAKGSAKMDALRAILSDRPRPTLVVAHFRDSVAAAARVAVEAGATVRTVDGGVSRGDRKKAIRSFQSGNLDVMVASIETVAEGMTLHQGGADQVIRVERHPLPSKNDQVIRRLHRIGQTRPVQVIDLITKDTWDVKLLRLLAEKTDQQMKALGRKDVRSLA